MKRSSSGWLEIPFEGADIDLLKKLDCPDEEGVVDLSDRHIGKEEISWISSSIHSATKVKVLRISHNNIGDEGAEILARGLRKNKTIKSLHISSGNIEDEGIRHLCAALRANTTLTTLSLPDNKIREIGAIQLRRFLKLNSSLECLNLDFNHIGDNGVDDLVKGICGNSNSSISAFHVKGNGIGNEGCHCISRLVRDYASLKSLSFGWERLEASAVVDFSDSLMNCKSLEELKFSFTMVGEEAAKSIMKLLLDHDSLRVVDIEGNSFGRTGAFELAKVLNTNKTLESIQFGYNSVGEDGAQEIVRVVEKNFSIRELSIRDEGLESYEEKILEMTHFNRTLEEVVEHLFSVGGGKWFFSAIGDEIVPCLNCSLSEDELRTHLVVLILMYEEGIDGKTRNARLLEELVNSLDYIVLYHISKLLHMGFSVVELDSDSTGLISCIRELFLEFCPTGRIIAKGNAGYKVLLFDNYVLIVDECVRVWEKILLGPAGLPMSDFDLYYSSTFAKHVHAHWLSHVGDIMLTIHAVNGNMDRGGRLSFQNEEINVSASLPTILRYAYFGRPSNDIDDDNILDILDAAVEMKLYDIVNSCEEHIMEYILSGKEVELGDAWELSVTHGLYNLNEVVAEKLKREPIEKEIITNNNTLERKRHRNCVGCNVM